MRITRETLLKTAKDTAAERARQDRRLVCIYLTGSLLQDSPLLGGTTDIDLVLVHDSDTTIEREIKRLTDEIHLDIAHLSAAVFRQPRHLRIDPWLGGYLCSNARVLFDVGHWFEFTQASVCAQFGRPEYVLQRARPLAESARPNWLDLHNGSIAAARPGQLQAYLKSLSNAANAIACLNGAPLTERRFVINYPARAEAVGRPGLAAGLVDLFSSQPIADDVWQSWTADWIKALQACGQLDNCPPRLQSCRLPYYVRAVETLRQEAPAGALWLLLRTWTQAISCLPQPTDMLPPWLSACAGVELDEDHFDNRLKSLDAYLDSVEETLDDWAKQMGL
jgi:hypothetical protein